VSEQVDVLLLELPHWMYEQPCLLVAQASAP